MKNNLTTQSKYEAISNLISDKELKFGCEVVTMGNSVKTITKPNSLYGHNFELLEDESGVYYGHREFKEILGTPPDLTRVLHFVEYKSDISQSDMWTQDSWWGIRDKILEKWNTAKPLLRDQSEEVIDFLYDLLPVEK